MKAVHFGAGNIGRGFIGELLHKSGYDIRFADINAEIIDELNEKRSYTIHYAGSEEQVEVSGISGLHSVEEAEELSAAIREADLVTTAVGPQVLPHIAPSIAAGLKERIRTDNPPLPVIACENMIGGSTRLKEEIVEIAGEKILEVSCFPDSAVDRIVPIQNNESRLDVSVEPYYEWVVEKKDFKEKLPDIDGVTYVDDLEPYIERKLFTVNTGHAAVAYKGAEKGYETIREAMDDQEVVTHVRRTLEETGDVLIRLYGFKKSSHEKYIEKIIERFNNPDLSDFISRVGRGPIRKLGLEDRLVRPARLYIQALREEPANLTSTIISALTYENSDDQEAVRLKELRTRLGTLGAFKEITGLTDGDELVKALAKKLN